VKRPLYLQSQTWNVFCIDHSWLCSEVDDNIEVYYWCLWPTIFFAKCMGISEQIGRLVFPFVYFLARNPCWRWFRDAFDILELSLDLLMFKKKIVFTLLALHASFLGIQLWYAYSFNYCSPKKSNYLPS
jgi:hypothetical protein